MHKVNLVSNNSKDDENTKNTGRSSTMNWKEFKDKVEAAGMKDDMDIWYIDITLGNDFDVKMGDGMGVIVA